RHIQKMIESLLLIEDRQQRQDNAYVVIELMGPLNPHLKNVEDFRHKLWDHLFLISDFKLDVDSPYPIPTRETLRAKPERLKYPKSHPRYNHLGKNIEVVMEKALKEENPEKRQGFANAIAYYMKLTYSNWHKELVHDDTIQQELSTMTKGELEFNNRPFVKHRTDNRPDNEYGGGSTGRNQYRKNFGSRDAGRDNRSNQTGGSRDNRSRSQPGAGRDAGNGNREGGARDNRNNNNNNNNRNFKKRY
ncbi:MAG: DUF4290 domain-containing protein, partial [Gloeobacteraceae cyanobacterium ES-bin-316]|nr:DUF4290 domain-containing protein [Ferruginibacter sp.]